MRRTTTFSAALAAFGWAAAFTIAQGQQDLLPPPTFTTPYSSQTTGPDYHQGPPHTQTAPVPVTGPMILQLGPPPTMYSPSADFKARVAALAFDDCTASVPPPCPPPSCAPPITAALPNGAQFTSDGSAAAPGAGLPIPPLSAVLPQIYSPGPPNPFYVAAPPPIAGLVCDCDGHCPAAQTYTVPSPTQMVWQPAPMTQPNPNCNYPPPMPPTCVAAAPTAIYPAPQPPSQIVYPAAMPPFPPAPVYAPPAIAYQPGMPSYGTQAAFGSPAIGEADRLDHILEAVHHLEAAGMHAEADHLRHECDNRLRTAIANLRTAEAQWARKHESSLDQHEPSEQHAACEPSAPKPTSQALATDQKQDSKQVTVHVQFLELNRTKLRNLGFDFASINPNNFVASAVGCLDTNGAVRCGTVDGPTAFLGFIDALRREDIVKILANPSVRTDSGRPASVFVGDEIPQVSGGANPTVEYAKIGTEINVVPIITGEDKVRLEIRGRYRTIDPHPAQALEAGGTLQPVIKTHAFDTATELASGHVLVLGGTTEKHLVSRTQEIPFVSDIADVIESAVFAMTDNEDLANAVASYVPGRRVQSVDEEEIEHLMLVQPEIVPAGEAVSKEEAQAAGRHPLTIDHWMGQPRVTPPQWRPVRPTAAESPAADEGNSEQLAPKFTVPPPESNSSDATGLLRSQCIPPATLNWSCAGELFPTAAAIHFEQLPVTLKIFDPGEFFGMWRAPSDQPTEYIFGGVKIAR